MKNRTVRQVSGSQLILRLSAEFVISSVGVHDTAGLLDIRRRARDPWLVLRLRILGSGLFVLLLCCLAPATLAGQSGEPLRVGVIRYKTDELVRETYTPFVEYIAEQSPHPQQTDRKCPPNRSERWSSRTIPLRAA